MSEVPLHPMKVVLSVCGGAFMAAVFALINVFPKEIQGYLAQKKAPPPIGPP